MVLAEECLRSYPTRQGFFWICRLLYAFLCRFAAPKEHPSNTKCSSRRQRNLWRVQSFISLHAELPKAFPVPVQSSELQAAPGSLRAARRSSSPSRSFASAPMRRLTLNAVPITKSFFWGGGGGEGRLLFVPHGPSLSQFGF